MTRTARALAIPLLAAACVAAPPTPAPPSAPAPAAARPGFRAVTPQGVDLVYDARARAYGVASQPGVYWLDGRFFRQVTGNWETASRLDGPWSACATADLPEGLR